MLWVSRDVHWQNCIVSHFGPGIDGSVRNIKRGVNAGEELPTNLFWKSAATSLHKSGRRECAKIMAEQSPSQEGLIQK
jgi:hypothetical protein